MPDNARAEVARLITFEVIDLVPGRFALTAEIDSRVRALSNAAPREGDIAHPIFAFVAGIGGLDAPIAQAIARAGCSMESGPLLASCAIKWHRPLRVGLTYDVKASIADKVRKLSRRFGVADHLLFRLGLTEAARSFVDLELRMIVPAEAA